MHKMQEPFVESLNLSSSEQSLLENSIKSFKEEIEKNPHSHSAYFNFGFSLQTQGKLEESIKAYTHAIRLFPKYAEAYNNLGTVLQDQGKLAEATSAYKSSIDINPEYLDAHFNLGNALQDENKLEEAEKAYSIVLKINPKHFNACYNMGIVLQQQCRFEEAAKLYEKAIALQPGHAESYYNMGIVLYQQNKLEEALNAFNDATNLNPKDADSFYNKGNVLNQQGKTEEAIEAYNKTISINPKHTSATYNLGTLLKNQGKLEDAMKAYDKVIKLDPQHVLAYCSRGNVLNQLCREEEALTDFDRAYGIMQRNKDNSEISDGNKSYINQILTKERIDLFKKISEIQKATIYTGKMLESIDTKKKDFQSELDTFTELKKSQKLTTHQVIESMVKNPKTVQIPVNQLKELEEKLARLQQQIADCAKTLLKHDKTLETAGVYDKARIKEEFSTLALEQPDLYKYCKTFYWTLTNYFAAYRSLGTNLQTGNINNGQTIKEKVFEKGTNKIVNLTKFLAQGIPLSGHVIGMIDKTIQLSFDTVKRAKFNEKVNAINVLLTLHNSPEGNLEEDISLLCANTAIRVTKAKKHKILEALSEPELPKDKRTSPLDGVKGKILQIKEQILPSIGLHSCRATDLALSDVIVLLLYIYTNFEEMADVKASLSDQFIEIIVQEKWRYLLIKSPAKDKAKQENNNPEESEDETKGRCAMF